MLKDFAEVRNLIVGWWDDYELQQCCNNATTMLQQCCNNAAIRYTVLDTLHFALSVTRLPHAEAFI